MCVWWVGVFDLDDGRVQHVGHDRRAVSQHHEALGQIAELVLAAELLQVRGLTEHRAQRPSDGAGPMLGSVISSLSFT